MRKNIVRSEAMPFKSNSSSVISTRIPVRRMAFLGSPFLLCAASCFLYGIILSWASAMRIRGAPTSVPNADEMVAPMMPAITAQGQRAVFTIIM